MAEILTGAESVTWNLNDLYAGPDDAKIEQDAANSLSNAKQLRQRYEGKIDQISSNELSRLLIEFESIIHDIQKPLSYAELLFSEDTSNTQASKLLQHISEVATAVESELLFFRHEWLRLDAQKVEELLSSTELSRWAHYLSSLQRYKPYVLSMPEERILNEKSLSSRNAWVRLFGELEAKITVDLDGQKVPLSTALARLYDSNREIRKHAAQKITESLKDGLHVRTYIFNAILLDKWIEDRLRGYPSWITERNLANEISDSTYQALIDAVTSRYDIPIRYYEIKRKILGLEELYDYDRYAPLGMHDIHMHWDEAKEFVLESYYSLDRSFEDIARRFFDERWIDASVRPNKRGGGFAHPVVPDVHPYILVNYTGKQRDALVIAHELGHGIHMILSSPRGIIEAQTPLTLAETASVFGETLAFNRMISQVASPSEKLALLGAQLESQFATIFRQVAMNRFEDTVHNRRRESGELSQEEIGQIWQSSLQTMFGNSLKLTDDHSVWWSYVGHFFHTPGYVYAYAFGNLLALALYARFEQQGSSFVEAYRRILEAGGSKRPDELLASEGINISDPNFWNQGLSVLEDMVVEVERLAKASG